MLKIFGIALAVIISLAAISAATFGINWFKAPLDAQLEHKVKSNSHQYIEAKKQRSNILRANLEVVNALLVNEPNNKNLVAQQRALNAQLRATY